MLNATFNANIQANGANYQVKIDKIYLPDAPASQGYWEHFFQSVQVPSLQETGTRAVQRINTIAQYLAARWLPSAIPVLAPVARASAMAAVAEDAIYIGGTKSKAESLRDDLASFWEKSRTFVHAPSWKSIPGSSFLSVVATASDLEYSLQTIAGTLFSVNEVWKLAVGRFGFYCLGVGMFSLLILEGKELWNHHYSVANAPQHLSDQAKAIVDMEQRLHWSKVANYTSLLAIAGLGLAPTAIVWGVGTTAWITAVGVARIFAEYSVHKKQQEVVALTLTLLKKKEKTCLEALSTSFDRESVDRQISVSFATIAPWLSKGSLDAIGRAAHMNISVERVEE